MDKKAPNPCPQCGAKDRWLGEVFPAGKVPEDVEKKELVAVESLAQMYGLMKNAPTDAQDTAGGSVLRISRSGNMISNFHPGAVPCLLCPACGQLTIVTDPTKIRLL